MLANSAVALLVIAPPGSAASPQELQRASVQGRANACAAGSPGHLEARAVYLSRFPQSEGLFAFADFSLYIITARSVRFIGGFGKATSILAEEFSSVMRAP
jgi:hypothetical protein